MAAWEARWTTGSAESSPFEIKQLAEHRESLYARVFKPTVDKLGALGFLLILAPIMVAVAVVVWIRIGRPVIFRQERVGKRGRIFEVYKFRTMIPDRRQNATPFVGRDRRRTHKSDNDPRVMPIGRFLRKWSLDELPQFFNVLKGDMSLVGPRPELPEIVADYEPWQHERHLVTPGITGLWQISRRERLLHECTELDLEYIQRQGFVTDLSILFATPVAMLSRSRGF